MKKVFTRKYEQQIRKILAEKGFSESQILYLLRGYNEYFNIHEFAAVENFSSVIDDILNGIKPKSVNAKHKYLALKEILKQRNISLPQAMALTLYSNSESNVAQFKRNLATPKQLFEKEKERLIESWEFEKKSLLSKEELDLIDDVCNVVKQEINKNIFSSFDVLKNMNLGNYLHYTLNFAIKCSNMVKTYKLMPQLNEVLKNQLPYNMILYRGLEKGYLQKRFGVSDLSKAIGMCFEDNGFSSTSLLFEDCFGAHATDFVTLRLFAPKGTQGLDITQFSPFETEREILLNSNDIFIVDYEEYERGCIMLTGFVLSKELECYKDIGKPKKQKENDDEENS